MSEASSPHAIDITCMTDPGGVAGVPNPTFDRARPELMRLSKDFFNRDLAPTIDNAPYRAFTMAVIWHEAMHERGYWHAEDSDNPLYTTRMPNIVGACMEEAFAQSETFCSFTPCPGGMSVMEHLGGDWNNCTCVRDPNAIPVLKDVWDWPGLTQVAVDGAGDGYVLASNGRNQTAFERSGHSWVSIGTATKIIAGGDAVAIRQPPSTAFSPTWWKVKSRVGGTTYVKAESQEQSVTMDAFGSMLRAIKGRVQRLSAGVTGWQDLGLGDEVFAGSDLVYRNQAGVTSRLDPQTGAWAVIGPTTGARTVDTYGSLYLLSPGSIMVRWRGSFWEWVGQEDTAIGAGDNFFARSTNGWVYRLAPSGWQAVAACDSFATGGRSMYCVRGTRLELYEY
jgi:hypothetical protein